MKKGQVIKQVKINKGLQVIKLDKIYPIEPIKHHDLKQVIYMIDDQKSEIEPFYANSIQFDAHVDGLKIDIICGTGYIAEEQPEWNQLFVNSSGWSGGDGIFSFNMENGNDSFDQKFQGKTLFVFGDTFVGKSNPITQHRLQPHLMPNNTIGYLENGKVDLKINWQEDGSVSGFYKMNPRFDNAGTVALNLVNYDRKEKNVGWLSGYNPKDIELLFDLYKERTISHMELFNYYSEEDEILANRGLKEIKVMGSKDNASWTLISQNTLEKSTGIDHKTRLPIEHSYRFIKIVVPAKNGLGNYNSKDYEEGLYGLNLIKFFNGTQQYRDVYAQSTSTLLKDSEHSWIWLQDGVIIGENLYFIPMVINSDLNQPEGLQFCVKGAALFKTPIVNKTLDISKATQKMAPLFVEKDDSQWLFGNALMPNTEQAGAKNPDGYIYIYGYKSTKGFRELILARVRAENFEYFDDWRFFDGSEWQTDIFSCKPLLSHISCEMSVSPLLKGAYKDKYIAVYTYDTNTPYVAFSLADHPWGPFTNPQKIYHTPEQDIFKSTTYTYNAKAHPHLSSSTDILVTYNTNTYNFDHNMSSYLIYRPRFIKLMDTSK